MTPGGTLPHRQPATASEESVRQAHPRHRYRTRRAIGPIITVVAAMSVAFLALVGPGFGRDATQLPGARQVALIAADRDPSSAASSTKGGASAPTSDVAPSAASGPAAAREDSSRPAPLGSGPVPRVHRHHAVPPAEVPLAAVSRLGRGARAVFLGDSFTSGWNGAGIGTRGWPVLVAAARGWKVVNLSVPGTGYMNPGWTDQTIGSRLGAAVRQKPQVVFVAGGHNDSRWSAATTSKAAITLIDRLHAALPDAVVVVIGPIWQNGSPPTRCLVLRDALRREAARIGAVFIDPLAHHWFAGTSHRFIGPDGLHPTDAGHVWLARRILAGLTGI